MTDCPLVSIVILNWNCGRFLPACIDSVLNQTYAPIDLTIMDNASEDGSVEWVRGHYPDLQLIENKDNLGFAKAHNVGIRQTRGSYYLPLNPDVVLTPTYVAEMVAALEDEERVGSASGRVYFTDDDGNPTRKLYTTGLLLTRNRMPANRGYKRKDTGQYETKDYIFGVNGACPLLRRTALEDMAIDGQYFDETFFLYAEDRDLAWRAQLLGWKSIYVPQAIAYHHGKGSGGLNESYIQLQFALNRYLEIFKNDLASHFLMDLPYILLYEILWQGYIFLTNPRRTVAHIKALIEFVRLLPQAHRMRKLVQARRTVTPQYMRSLFVGMVLR
jgi:GT2 family glycosyltransferase